MFMRGSDMEMLSSFNIIKGEIKMKVTPKFVFFYANKDIYSNFYKVSFEHQGIQFPTSEHAVMYRKAKLFGADDIAEKITKVKNPGQAKALGRSRDIPFDEDVWKEYREKVYFEVLVDKFSDEDLKEQLLGTGKRILVEASPYDKIWGVGLAEDNPAIQYPQQWKGLNLLGKVLMEVREYYQ